MNNDVVKSEIHRHLDVHFTQAFPTTTTTTKIKPSELLSTAVQENNRWVWRKVNLSSISASSSFIISARVAVLSVKISAWHGCEVGLCVKLVVFLMSSLGRLLALFSTASRPKSRTENKQSWLIAVPTLRRIGRTKIDYNMCSKPCLGSTRRYHIS